MTHSDRNWIWYACPNKSIRLGIQVSCGNDPRYAASEVCTIVCTDHENINSCSNIFYTKPIKLFNSTNGSGTDCTKNCPDSVGQHCSGVSGVSGHGVVGVSSEVYASEISEKTVRKCGSSQTRLPVVTVLLIHTVQTTHEDGSTIFPVTI